MLDLVHSVVVVGMGLVVLMVVFMVMLVLVVVRVAVELEVRVRGLFLRAVHLYRNMGAADAAFADPLPGNLHTRYPDPVQILNKSVLVGEQLQQRGGEHIPRRPHTAVQIECFHFVSSM